MQVPALKIFHQSAYMYEGMKEKLEGIRHVILQVYLGNFTSGQLQLSTSIAGQYNSTPSVAMT